MGKLSNACMKGGQKFVDGLRYVLAVFRLWRPSQGPWRVPKGSQCTTQCGMRRQDKIFYCGIISLWEIWTLLAWEIDQEIYDDLRYALAVFRFWGAPQDPLRVPNGFQWTIKFAFRSRDKILDYGIISLWENWVFLAQKVKKVISDDLMTILAVFRLWGVP